MRGIKLITNGTQKGTALAYIRRRLLVYWRRPYARTRETQQDEKDRASSWLHLWDATLARCWSNWWRSHEVDDVINYARRGADGSAEDPRPIPSRIDMECSRREKFKMGRTSTIISELSCRAPRFFFSFFPKDSTKRNATLSVYPWINGRRQGQWRTPQAPKLAKEYFPIEIGSEPTLLNMWQRYTRVRTTNIL